MLQALRLLLPALVPSWNFFDAIAASPRIEYAQTQSRGEEPADWREFRPRPERVLLPAMLARLFWNARWNEALFAVSCAERLIAEPTAHSEDELFHRIAADLADRQETSAPWLRFRILLIAEDEGELIGDIAFASDPRRLAAIPVR